MRRRAYLCGLATGIATPGCLAATDPSDDSNAMSDDSPDHSRRQIQLELVETPPDGLPISFDLEVQDPWISPDSTAKFEIRTINHGDSEIRIEPAFYKGTSRMFDAPGLVVYNYRAKDFDVEKYTPSCFSDDQQDSFVKSGDVQGERRVLFTREGVGPEPIDPEGERIEEFIVADDPTVDGCFPIGTYTFETKHYVLNDFFTFSFEVQVASVY